MMILFALALVSGAEAQTKFSARTLMVKQQKEAAIQKARRAGNVEEQTVSCFIHFSAPCEEQLKALGVKPQVVLDDLMTANVPVSVMDKVAALKAVTYIEVSAPEYKNSDKARESSNVSKILHDGVNNGLPKNFDGTGVAIGVIDGGVDFQHPALRTADGHSRCSLVYLPDRPYVEGMGGVQPKIGENILDGVLYTDQAQIDTLTCDLPYESHGTHTVSTAAGSEVDIYGGVATGADLMVAAMGEKMSDTELANAMTLLADYAEKQGKRLVISKSVGSILGPHDGTSPAVKFAKEITDRNVIFCQSAGNSGESNCYIHFKRDSLQNVSFEGVNRTYWAMVGVPWWGAAKEKDVVNMTADLWCSNEKPFDIAVLNYNVSSGLAVVSEILTFEKFSEPDGSFDMVHKRPNDDKLEVFGNLDKNNGKYNYFLRWTLHTYKNTNYFEEGTHIGLMILPRDENQEVRMWMSDTYGQPLENHRVLYNPSNLMLMTGNSTLSANDNSCLNSLIGVGNYTTKTSYVTLDGQTHKLYDDSFLGRIAQSSSYGTSLNGVVIPMVSGPGTTIVAAVNHSDYSYSNDAQASMKKTVNGTDFYWAQMEGTSMSTPHVAGIMALWLQANPKLTVQDIQNVLAKTSVPWEGSDADKARWGQYGRIDALAGIKYILQSSDIRDLQVEKTLDDKGDIYNINGQLVRSGVTASEGVSGLPAGIYVVNGRKVVVK